MQKASYFQSAANHKKHLYLFKVKNNILLLRMREWAHLSGWNRYSLSKEIVFGRKLSFYFSKA